MHAHVKLQGEAVGLAHFRAVGVRRPSSSRHEPCYNVWPHVNVPAAKPHKYGTQRAHIKAEAPFVTLQARAPLASCCANIEQVTRQFWR